MPHSRLKPSAGPPWLLRSSYGIRVAVHPLSPILMPDVGEVRTVVDPALKKAGA